jgi:hypothetical protein
MMMEGRRHSGWCVNYTRLSTWGGGWDGRIEGWSDSPWRWLLFGYEHTHTHGTVATVWLINIIEHRECFSQITERLYSCCCDELPVRDLEK